MTSTQKTTLPKVIFIKAIFEEYRHFHTLHHHGLQEKDRKERGSKTDIFTRFELWRMKFPDTNDIRYRCNDIDECRKSNDVEQERIRA